MSRRRRSPALRWGADGASRINKENGTATAQDSHLSLGDQASEPPPDLDPAKPPILATRWHRPRRGCPHDQAPVGRGLVPRLGNLVVHL